LHTDGKVYCYPGFVESDGVRYLGQSVLFVTTELLEEIRSFLWSQAVNHVVMTAWLGSIVTD